MCGRQDDPSMTDAGTSCTGTDDDCCSADPELGTCPACGYVTHDATITPSRDEAHGELCCGSAGACTVSAGELCVTHG